VNISGI